jgi:uncharacterized protein (TIGR00369 family)
MDAIPPATAQALLASHFAPWVQALDLQVQEIAPTHVLIRMPLGDHLARFGGIVSGQALAALADTAMVLAAIGHAGKVTPFATTDLHTQFLKAGTGSAVLCRAQVTRAGRAMVFARADMTEADSAALIATATASFYRP